VTRILFGGYSGIDFSMIAPLFPLLREKGVDFAIINRYDLAPTRRQLRGLRVFQPPDISGKLLSPSEIELVLPTIFDTRSVEHFLPAWRGKAPGLRFLTGWSDYYFEFALETIDRYGPDLVVVSMGEAETEILRRVCDLTSRSVLCLVPQRYEFKSVEFFSAHPATTYLVAGEYGRERFLRKGIAPERVLVTGNPRFDRASAAGGKDRSRAGPRRTILYPLQAVGGESRLFELLRRYVSSRQGVRLVVRPHPNLPLRQSLPFARHALTEPVRLAMRQPLDVLLGRADVLVSMWSLTVLEALIAGLPVVSWKSDFMPAEMPFEARGDTLPARNYGDLEHGLDRLLFDADFRGAWLDRHRDCHVPYTGILDGNAAARVVDAIETLATV
jgi:hypothetical protein